MQQSYMSVKQMFIDPIYGMCYNNVILNVYTIYVAQKMKRVNRKVWRYYYLANIGENISFMGKAICHAKAFYSKLRKKSEFQMFVNCLFFMRKISTLRSLIYFFLHQYPLRIVNFILMVLIAPM